MKKYYTIIVQFIFVVSFVTIAHAWDGLSSMEARLLSKINSIRSNPEKVINELGFSMDDILSSHPFFEEYMDVGMPALTSDTRLYLAAESHALEMVKEKYFSKISLDGSLPHDRYQKYSFYSKASDEALSVLLFRNYLPKDLAVDTLFKSIIENELKCTEKEEFSLFNPNYKELGLSIKSGSMEIEGVKLNFYLAVVDFGLDVVSRDEKQLFVNMNLARHTFDPVNNLPDKNELEIKVEYLSPYSFDMNFYLIGKQLIKTAIDEISRTEDNSPLKEDSILSSTDFTELSSQFLKLWVTSKEKTAQEVREYFLPIILSSEEMISSEDSVLYNPVNDIASISMEVSVPIKFDEGNEYFVHAISFISGITPPPREMFEVSGVLYIDLDGNKQYSLGEGYDTGILKIIRPDQSSWSVFTGKEGEFSFAVPSGSYTITNGDPQNQIGFIEKNIDVNHNNIMIFQECEKAEKPE